VHRGELRARNLNEPSSRGSSGHLWASVPHVRRVDREWQHSDHASVRSRLNAGASVRDERAAARGGGGAPASAERLHHAAWSVAAKSWHASSGAQYPPLENSCAVSSRLCLSPTLVLPPTSLLYPPDPCSLHLALPLSLQCCTSRLLRFRVSESSPRRRGEGKRGRAKYGYEHRSLDTVVVEEEPQAPRALGAAPSPRHGER
jgi:hypothetical protein